MRKSRSTIGQLEKGFMPDIPKVPEDQFKAVIRALLNTPPLPLADIPRKREPKASAKKPVAKKCT
jgi:hypothetical protein